MEQLDTARMAYDSKNEAHEAKLMKLWELLRPGVRLRARICPDWQEIGFQGHDPATDFRSMGVLGLDHLIQFSQDYKAHSSKILGDSVSHRNWFSYAITSLHMTFDAYNLIKERKVNAFFFRYGSTLEALSRLHATMFVRFNAAWTEADPENVMEFKSIHDDFMKSIEKDSKQGRLVAVDYK
jgi:hypothetical protein